MTARYANRSRFRCILHALGSCQKNDVARPEGTLKSSRRAQSLPGGGKYTQSPDDEGTKANGCFYAAKNVIHFTEIH